MITISLCMIVRDEEENLENCLASVASAVDEIVVVDTGSRDRTKEIAQKYTQRIYDFPWVDDFAKARNFSYDQAGMDYILWLDADDVLLPADCAALRALKENLDPAVDCVMMRYNTGFDATGNVTFHYLRERLVKRERHFQWKDPVHEYIEVTGQIAETEIAVTHCKMNAETSDRNLIIYERRLATGEELSPRGLYYYARELKDHGRYGDAIVFFNRFLDTGQGWLEDNIVACRLLAECYRRQDMEDQQHLALVRSFRYDTPRAETCCDLGYLYKNKGDFERAVFWFHLAVNLEKPKHNWGFMEEDCWGFLPYLELAVCCDRLGQYELAASYNERAAWWKPEDPAVLHNRSYFESLK